MPAAPPPRNVHDYSIKKDGNPTQLLQDVYQSLMALTTLEELKTQTTAIVEGSKISRKNLAKFQRERDRIDTLSEFQLYVSNFILAGSGMSTFKRGHA